LLLKSRLICYTRSQLLSLKPGVLKCLPYFLALKLKDHALIHTRGNRAGICVHKRKENEVISVNQHQKIEIVKSHRLRPVLNQHYLNYKVNQMCRTSNLVPVKIVGRGPAKPKFVPVCMVMNARSLVYYYSTLVFQLN
jgi:hypothetical protein